MKKPEIITCNLKSEDIDILGRDEFINNCQLLIDTVSQTTKSAFIMIDGEWGVGKTFVMNKLKNSLKKGYAIIEYNCWENSYYNDPLEAILSTMLDVIDKDKIWNDKNKRKFKELGNIVLKLLTLGGIDILNTAIEQIPNTNSNDDKNNYNLLTNIKNVKEFLKCNDKKIVILIDELDRCLPEYMIKTLERLYLLFKDAPNFVLVIANDKSKIEKSILSIFNLSSIDNYLEKFIDYTLKLNRTKTFSNDIEQFKNKYSFYFENFELCNDFWECINCLFSKKDIRNIEKTIHKANKLHKLCFDNNKKYYDSLLMAELTILEYSNLEYYMPEYLSQEAKNDSFASYMEKLSSVVTYEIENYPISHSLITSHNFERILESKINKSTYEYICLLFLLNIINNEYDECYFGYEKVEKEYDVLIAQLKKFKELALIIL